MAEGDDWRVEARTVLVGMGMANTPERIADIERRQRQVDKATRPKPTKSFAAVAAQKRGSAPKAVSAKQRKLESLPPKGPRPSLVHPGQREAFGRDDDDTVVLKG